MNKKNVFVFAAAICLLLVGVTTMAQPMENAELVFTGGTTTRVSVTSDGTQGNGYSGRPAISADGRYIAFDSSAGNLVSSDTNSIVDIFVHDIQTGQTSRISVASNGTQGNGHSSIPSISADGRYVAFYSSANNLVGNDMNDTGDIFVHDRQTGQTTRVSVASDGTQGNVGAFFSRPSVSANGRYVAFSSDANNLVDGDTNNTGDTFVHDRQTGQTERVSVASDGTQGNGGTSLSYPSISADGHYVAFSSDANNLVSGDTNDRRDTFIHNLQTRQTTRVSVTSDGTEGNGSTSYSYPSVSADARYVVFSSDANNLVGNDTNDNYDIFVHDRQTGQTTRVSVASDGTQGNGLSVVPSISADVRYIAFQSDASNLVLDDTNSTRDVFVHDRQTGQTMSVSVAPDGIQGNDQSAVASISADGRYVAFGSYADNLISDDTNSYADIFVHDLGNADTALVERFAPYMYFHQDEPYRPIAVTVPLHHSQLTSIANLSLLNAPTFYDLMTLQWNVDSTYINLKGDGREDINNIYSSVIDPEVRNSNGYMLAYARVQRDDARGKIAIQYWFYYYANPWVNYHEGDWEMVQVVLDSNETPLYAAYTHHLVHSKRWWSDMETSGDHPIVYVANGGHGNYFKPYSYWQGGQRPEWLPEWIPMPPFGIDETFPNIYGGIPQIEMFHGEVGTCQNTSQDPWPCFQGHWGTYPEMGFPGPGHVIFERWDDPLDWSESAVDLGWDESGWHNNFIKFNVAALQPLDVHVYEIPTLAHVGWNNGQPEIEIDDAEYFDNPATGLRTIILHDISPFNPLYQTVFKWRSSNVSINSASTSVPITATINFPDTIAGTSITATYTFSGSWEILSTGVVTASHDSDFEMMVDIDGDGTIDHQLIPVLEENPVDFTPPAAITDLTVTPIASGAATLNWTAPGDDGNTGTATAYDIRYSTAPIMDSNWVLATLIVPPIPVVAGSPESFTVTGVPGKTLYFAIRSVDEVYRSSTLSNVVEVEIPPYKIYLPAIICN